MATPSTNSPSINDAINLWVYLNEQKAKDKLFENWTVAQIYQTAINSARDKGLFWVRGDDGKPAGIIMTQPDKASCTVHVKAWTADNEKARKTMVQWFWEMFSGWKLTARRGERLMVLDPKQANKLIRRLYKYGQA